jgi:DNA-binding SARP family transcriptional activator
MRMLRRMSSPDPTSEPGHSAAAIDTDIVLDRFSGIPALHAFEAANYGLGLPEDQGGPSPRTTFRAICVGAAGVDFWLAEPGQPAPVGFLLSADDKVWHSAHNAFTETTGTGPFLPIVLPVGEDDAGTWLVPLRLGGRLPLLGDAGDDLWRAARRAQEAWAWSDMVLITEDPSAVARELALFDDRDESIDAPQVLFFGDPASLSDAQGAKVAIVTRSVVTASDVTVLVDRAAASIHPLGRTVRPHLMGADTSALVDELVALPPLVAPAGPGDLLNAEQAAFEDSTPRPLRHDPLPAATASRTECLSLPDARTVEVRLLTATPRLEGLRETLPPNRARRAIELVAYLALHAGDEVTSDRLRTRVLGSSDADAASKTLFNIAAAARRAMGTDPAGMTLFPAGSRTGLYRVSEGVSVDVHRAAALAAEGSATEDPDTAMALLRSALSLVEGEPLANALSGYGWWEAEGHGARAAAVLVNAACDLAALAVSAGRFELARWGLGQARMVDPYSEAVSRVAMQVAAAAGDADRLRREWRECQRRVDELDPGSSPSPRTERLYRELARGVLVGVTTTASDR